MFILIVQNYATLFKTWPWVAEGAWVYVVFLGKKMNLFTGPGVELIKFYEDKIIDKLPESILDLGCKKGLSFYYLYHELSCVKRYVGIDNSSETAPHMIDLGYDQKDYINNSIDGFKQISEFHYDTDVFDYFNSTEEKFDLIVLSNLLHFTTIKPRWREVLRLAKERLNKGGMMYVKVMDSKYTYYTKNTDYKLFTETEIKELEMLSIVKQCVYNHWTFLILT